MQVIDGDRRDGELAAVAPQSGARPRVVGHRRIGVGDGFGGCRQFGGDRVGPLAEKVSHLLGSPVWYPVVNHFCRSADDPCVHVSGLTRPVEAFWMRSSPTEDAADSASAMSLSVNGSKNVTPVLSCLVIAA